MLNVCVSLCVWPRARHVSQKNEEPGCSGTPPTGGESCRKTIANTTTRSMRGAACFCAYGNTPPKIIMTSSVTRFANPCWPASMVGLPLRGSRADQILPEKSLTLHALCRVHMVIKMWYTNYLTFVYQEGQFCLPVKTEGLGQFSAFFCGRGCCVAQ